MKTYRSLLSLSLFLSTSRIVGRTRRFSGDSHPRFESAFLPLSLSLSQADLAERARASSISHLINRTLQTFSTAGNLY